MCPRILLIYIICLTLCIVDSQSQSTPTMNSNTTTNTNTNTTNQRSSILFQLRNMTLEDFFLIKNTISLSDTFRSLFAPQSTIALIGVTNDTPKGGVPILTVLTTFANQSHVPYVAANYNRIFSSSAFVLDNVPVLVAPQNNVATLSYVDSSTSAVTNTPTPTPITTSSGGTDPSSSSSSDDMPYEDKIACIAMGIVSIIILIVFSIRLVMIIGKEW
eukprot:PhF_6_TR38722/c0_g1_i2/m.57954